MLKNKNLSFLFLFIAITFSACSDSGEPEEKVKPDTVNPTIICPENIEVTVDQFSNGIALEYMSPVSSDNSEGALTTQTEGNISGSNFPIGTTTNTFEVKDKAGNTATCSFDITVIRNAPSDNMPYFIATNPTPTGKTWEPISALTDEFDGSEIDNSKWTTDPSAHPHLKWPGRPPAIFQSERVNAIDGKMTIEVGKLPAPVIDNTYANPQEYTFYGGGIRSKTTTTVGNYYECKMKMNKTEMGGGFWLMGFTSECDKRHEIDVTESIGIMTNQTAQWAKNAKWDEIFHSNVIRREDKCKTNQDRDEKYVNTPTKNHERYYVYGCWWKSSTELLFYLDGEYKYTATPPVPFNQLMYLQFDIEAYDWNPFLANGSTVETGTLAERTTHVEYIRSFKLVDK